MQDLINAGPWAVVFATIALLLRGTKIASFLKSPRFRKVVEAAVDQADDAAEQAKNLADVVADAFSSQYGVLVKEVAALQAHVDGLTQELVSARREIEGLRDALASAHTEIERLTAKLTGK